MKFKPYYLYIIIAIAAVAVLLIVTNDQNTTKQTNETKMPEDDIHKGLKENPPGKGNVSEEAIQQLDMLKKAVQENPNDTAKAREYADFLAQAHQQDEAIIQYEKILSKDPKRVDLILSIAFIHYNRGEYKEAEAGLNRILAIDKDNLQARYNLGAIAANQGDYARAKILWQKLVKEYPGTEMAELAKSSLSKL